MAITNDANNMSKQTKELIPGKNQQFIVNWFSNSIPEGDYYYHWRLFDEWQGDVNPGWHDLDIDTKVKLFTEFDKSITDPSDFCFTEGLH